MAKAPSNALTIQRLTAGELWQIAEKAGVMKRMAAGRFRIIRVDYIPERQAIAMMRDKVNDTPIDPVKPTVVELIFVLEDCMIAGNVYAALTCGSRVIIEPFRWAGYASLAGTRRN